MDLPSIEDEVVVFEGGPTITVRRAFYPSGRVETFVEPYGGEPAPGCRCLLPDGTLAEWSSGPARRLPEAILASVLHSNGLWDLHDATDAVLDMDAAGLAALRDGMPGQVPGLPETTIDFEICASISQYFGRMPDYDGYGIAVAREIDDMTIEEARSLRHSSIWMKPPGVGRG